MLFTSIVLHAFTRVMVVRQLDNLSLWSTRFLLTSYGVAVGLQLPALYTPLRYLFGVVALDPEAYSNVGMTGMGRLKRLRLSGDTKLDA
jgi:hypothetical protein